MSLDRIYQPFNYQTSLFVEEMFDEVFSQTVVQFIRLKS